MSKTAMLVERIDKMASAMQLMATMLGTRLNHNQLAERLGSARRSALSRSSRSSSRCSRCWRCWCWRVALRVGVMGPSAHGRRLSALAKVSLPNRVG